MSFARVRALVVVGALALAALIFVVVALVRDTQTGPVEAQGCPDGYVLARVTLPEPKDVKINVLNATPSTGLGGQVAEDFTNRQFQVEKVAAERRQVKEVAVLRYGPEAVGAAHLLRAYFLNAAVPQYDPKRKEDVVDVVIGTAFQELGTVTEVNHAVAALGKPELPPGACAAPES